MEIMDIVALAGAIGGAQGIIELSKWWLSRKAALRQSIAEAEAAENTNDRQQTDWLEQRLKERDEKVYEIYSELRQTQATLLDKIHENHEQALQLKEAEIKKCCKHGCPDRIPPSDY